MYGSIPRRVGLDGRLPESWAGGDRRWDGWLDTAQYPRISDPPGGRLWTANARVVNGEMLDRLGDGGYDIGSRARLIRDRLAAKERFTARDLLDIQLDTRADFIGRWRTVILNTLSPAVTAASGDRHLFREIVEQDWSGHADSAAYRLTRAFREIVSERVVAFVLSECYEADPSFDYGKIRRREAPIWTLVTEQPLHLLDPKYASWEQMLVEGVDATIEQLMRDRSGDLRDRAWSEYNVAAYRHPLSAGIPVFGRWPDMPRTALSGDLYTPRVHWGSIAASQRMVVSPGHEAEGIMHMPTGQSWHPLSPFYANSHNAWLNGEPTLGCIKAPSGAGKTEMSAQPPYAAARMLDGIARGRRVATIHFEGNGRCLTKRLKGRRIRHRQVVLLHRFGSVGESDTMLCGRLTRHRVT